MGNITVTCNIQMNPKKEDMYSYGVVMVKRRSSNETVRCAKNRHSLNVSVVIARKEFMNESSFTCICFAKTETEVCAQLHHKLNVLGKYYQYLLVVMLTMLAPFTEHCQVETVAILYLFYAEVHAKMSCFY